MQVTLKIFRYNPKKDKHGHYETYTLEADENERMLDLLEMVKGHHDGTLSFRRSCAHGVCGSDAMRINGQNHLACKTLVRDVGDEDHGRAAAGPEGHQGPDRGYGAVLRQLQEGAAVLHQRQPAARGRQGAPAISRSSAPASTKPPSASCARPAPPPARPSGPATIISARRRSSPRIASSSTAATRPPPSACKIVSETSGVARCHTVYNCTMACPRDIQITKAIGELKMAMMTGKLE